MSEEVIHNVSVTMRACIMQWSEAMLITRKEKNKKIKWIFSATRSQDVTACTCNIKAQLLLCLQVPVTTITIWKQS